MPFPNSKLRVFPNPWVFVDHLGRPAGRLPFDAYEGSPSFGFVGATLTDVKLIAKEMVFRVAGQDIPVNPAQHDHRITYSKEPVEIQNTAYYRDAVKRLDLIAADSETASTCGLLFVDPSRVLAKQKAEAIAKFDAETAEDAWKRFGAVEPIYTSSVPETVQSAPVKVEAAKVTN